MATGSILLSPGSGVSPDGSAGNAAPALTRRQGSEANPKKAFLTADFDPTTDEHLYWTFPAPANLGATPAFVAKVHWRANAVTGTCRWGCRLGAVTPADADTLDEHALDTATTAGTATDTTEARRSNVTTLTIADADRDAAAAGDVLVFLLYRDADGTSGTDDLAVDAELIAVELQYTTS